MNTLGPGADESASIVGIPEGWKRFGPLIPANQRRALLERLPGVRSGVHGITYQQKKGFVSYGVDTNRTSFTDRTTDIGFGARPNPKEIEAGLLLAVHRFSEPIQITGTDAFKGAVLDVAIKLNIQIANPELQTLQSILIHKNYPNGRRPQKAPQPQAQAQQPTPTRQRDFEPIVEPTVSDGARPFADIIHERMAAQHPGQAKAVAMPPDQQPNSTQIYTVLAGTENEYAIDYGKGLYQIVSRTSVTGAVQPGDTVTITTNDAGAITLVAPFIDTIDLSKTHAAPNVDQLLTRVAPTERQKAQIDNAQEQHVQQEAAKQSQLNGFSRDLMLTSLKSEARTLLAAKGTSPKDVKEVPFEFPSRATTMTILAMNDSGVAIAKGSATYMVAERGKYVLPSGIEPGARIAFRLVNGQMMMVNASTIAPTTSTNAQNPKRTVTH